MRRVVKALAGACLMTVAVWPAASQAAVPVPAVRAAACRDAELVPAPDNLARVRAALLCLINRERTTAGRVPLARAWRLDRSSEYHSTEMVGFHFLAHEAAGHPGLLDRIRRFGYFNGATSGLYSENIGAGASSNGSAKALMDAWMGSPGHRANILYPSFRDVGIGAVLAGPDPAFFADFPSTVYTTDFGRRYTARARCTARPRREPRGSATPRRRYCRRRR